MRPVIRLSALAFAALVLAAACGGPSRFAVNVSRPFSERSANIQTMLTYDESGDGVVSRAEMDSMLRAAFAAADTNGDGRIDFAEMQAENGRRFRTAGTLASPLIDWNRNGQIDFDEFGTTARSLFAELDRNNDGELDRNELRIPRRAQPVLPGGLAGEGLGPAP